MTGVVLLMDTSDGDVVAVRFPDVEAARDWEDEHEVPGRGVIRLVGQQESLRMAPA